MNNSKTQFYKEPNELLKCRRLKEYTTQFINKWFSSDKSIHILDIACGHGLFLHACKESGYNNYEGVDIDEVLLKYGEKKLKLKNLTRKDFVTFLKSKPSESYDVITAFNIIEHIKKDEIETIFSLIYEKLKQNGIFIMEVPNADSPLGIHTLYSDLTHKTAFTQQLLVQLFDLVNFKNISITPKFINKNPFIRFGQKILARMVGLDDKLMFSGNIVAVGYKK